jgi:TPR repeat protein
MKDKTFDGSISPISSFNLTEEQLDEFSQKAEKGDAEAAFRLYQYLDFLVPDSEKGHYWLGLSAKNGHITAQYNMAVILYQKGKIDDALYWAGMAKRNGDKNAVQLIDEIHMKVFGSPPISPALSFKLTKGQVIEFSYRAEKRDAEAALKLYEYFRFFVSDTKKASYWLELSAKNKNRVAQLYKAYVLYEEKKFKEALFWAKMAKLNGHEKADSLIDEICASPQNICEDSSGSLEK